MHICYAICLSIRVFWMAPDSEAAPFIIVFVILAYFYTWMAPDCKAAAFTLVFVILAHSVMRFHARFFLFKRVINDSLIIILIINKLPLALSRCSTGASHLKASLSLFCKRCLYIFRYYTITTGHFYFFIVESLCEIYL